MNDDSVRATWDWGHWLIGRLLWAVATVIALVATFSLSLLHPLVILITPAVGLFAFLVLDRPAGWVPPKGVPPADAGRLWGRNWVRIQGRVYWPSGREAQRLRMLPRRFVPVGEATIDGSVVRLVRSVIPRPTFRAVLMNSLVHTVAFSVVFALVTSMAYLVSLSGPPTESGLVMLLVAIQAFFGFIILVVLGIWGIAAATVSYLYTRAASMGHVEVLLGKTHATIRTALTAPQRFDLGQPDEAINRGWDSRGSWMRLRNARQDVMVRAEHQALDWLEEKVLAGADVGAVEAVPHALRALQAQ